MRVFQSPSPPPTCFFCCTTLSHQPRNANSFKCPSCLCWNRYDKTGQIVSDEPAMRDESLNVSSFAKRASPSKHRLPTSYGKGPFCHSCLTNQTLLVNLLSNYLPSPEDPTYEARVAEMPAYTASLQNRYPPVCKDCQPTVDEELRNKEHMARTTALGAWLKQSQHVGTQRYTEQQRGRNDVVAWKLRGAMWTGTLTIFILVNLAGVLQYDLHRRELALTLPMLALISVLWTFWDPTWRSVRDSRLQGRTFRVYGRERHIRCQMIIWLFRLSTSGLIALQWFGKLASCITSYHIRCWYATTLGTEIVLGAFSLGSLRIQRPPKVRLLEPRNLKGDSSRDSSTPTPDAGQQAVSSLSLTPHTPSTAKKPVFGQPSFPNPVPDVAEEDRMDWTPTHPQGAIPERVQDREGWMRPQRFFPPEQPTGLEDLFEKARLDVEGHSEKQDQPQGGGRDEANDELREMALFFAAAIIIALVAGLGVYRF